MKYLLIIAISLFTFNSVNAQLTMPADGGSVRAQSSETIGITKISIDYGRPAVNGREGKIWGGIVQEGFNNPGGVAWRAGANENTTIEFSTDVLIGGQPLTAGKYGFHVLYHPDVCTLIFCKNTEAWGSYFYNEKDDVLRVTATPQQLSTSQERLVYSFFGETDSSVIVSLAWEKLAIPFTVNTELHKLMLANIEREMNSTKIFNPESYMQASKYYVEHNIELEKALSYARIACGTFHNLNASIAMHDVYKKMGKNKEADSVLADAVQNAELGELHSYARSFIISKNYDRALELFKINYKKYPKEYTANVGMARGYSAIGDYKKALRYTDKAKPMAPDEPNRQALEQMIAALKSGKDIN